MSKTRLRSCIPSHYRTEKCILQQIFGRAFMHLRRSREVERSCSQWNSVFGIADKMGYWIEKRPDPESIRGQNNVCWCSSGALHEPSVRQHHTPSWISMRSALRGPLFPMYLPPSSQQPKARCCPSPLLMRGFGFIWMSKRRQHQLIYTVFYHDLCPAAVVVSVLFLF